MIIHNGKEVVIISENNFGKCIVMDVKTTKTIFVNFKDLKIKRRN